MSNISDKLHNHLSQEFEYDRADIYEFGWCNIIEAEDRIFKRLVRLYVPRDDVWSNGSAKKHIKKQFSDYYKEKTHECLPEAIDLLEGKNAKGSMILVTSRAQEKNLMSGERSGKGISWLENDEFSFPEKLGAVRKLVQAINILHGFGMIHGSLGHQTISCVSTGKGVLLRVTLLNFSDVSLDEPAASLFFEPAFTAPELFEGGASNQPAKKSPETDVYSLGKFILYFLLGPVRFMMYFSEDDEEMEEPKKVISSKLSDHILWTNIAHSNAEHDAVRLEKLSNDKLSAEIAEFLTYTISHISSVRPDDAQMFYHGLSTIMAGEIDMPSGPAGGGWQAEKSGPNMALLGGVGVAVVIMLIGGYMFMNARAEKQALNKQIATTAQSCSQFMGSFEKLKDSRITGLESWANIDFIKDRVRKNGKTNDKLLQNQQLCDQGNTAVTRARTELIQKLRSDITLGVENSADEGTDFAALDVDQQLKKADTSQVKRNFTETEATLGDLADKINEKRDLVITDSLEGAIAANSVAQDLLGLTDMSKAEENLNSKAQAAVGLEVSSANLAKKKAALIGLHSFNISRLSKDATAIFDEISTLMEKLKTEDAADAGIGFTAVSQSVSDIQSQGQPNTITGYQSYYQGMLKAAESLSEMNTHMGTLAADLPRFTQNIKLSLATVEQNNWLEEAQIAALRAQFLSRESFSIYKDWSFLGKLDKSLNEEVKKLEAQRAEGNAVCSAMLATVDNSQNMETTLIWPELSEILSRIRSIDPAAIGREHFTECEKGYLLSKRGNIELQAKELVQEIKDTMAALIENGVGPYIEEFSLASSGYDDLKEVNLPQSQESYDTYASQAYLILANLDKSEEVYGTAVSTKKGLRKKFDDIVFAIEETPLGQHPEYIRVKAGLSISPDLNILEHNKQLEMNVETLAELVKKFEDGTLINCSFQNGFAMLPILSDADKLEKGSTRIAKSVRKSGVSYEGKSNGVLTFCINANPVTYDDLQAFGETLKTRQTDIKAEIDSVVKGSTGAAVNISFWLASRYATWVGKQVKQPVCVSSAVAAVMAEATVPDKFETISTGELFSDSCGTQNAVRKKLVLYDVEDTGMSAGCVSNNSLRPKLSFRLAAGDICSE
jgi:serine/threonine protein kinase